MSHFRLQAVHDPELGKGGWLRFPFSGEAAKLLDGLRSKGYGEPTPNERPGKAHLNTVENLVLDA